jgi:hypothetical protein
MSLPAIVRNVEPDPTPEAAPGIAIAPRVVGEASTVDWSLSPETLAEIREIESNIGMARHLAPTILVG